MHFRRYFVFSCIVHIILMSLALTYKAKPMIMINEGLQAEMWEEMPLQDTLITRSPKRNKLDKLSPHLKQTTAKISTVSKVIPDIQKETQKKEEKPALKIEKEIKLKNDIALNQNKHQQLKIEREIEKQDQQNLKLKKQKEKLIQQEIAKQT